MNCFPYIIIHSVTVEELTSIVFNNQISETLQVMGRFYEVFCELPLSLHDDETYEILDRVRVGLLKWNLKLLLDVSEPAHSKTCPVVMLARIQLPVDDLLGDAARFKIVLQALKVVIKRDAKHGDNELCANEKVC